MIMFICAKAVHTCYQIDFYLIYYLFIELLLYNFVFIIKSSKKIQTNSVLVRLDTDFLQLTDS